jgi:hypothetical protein
MVGAAVYPERVLVASVIIDGHAVALRLERADHPHHTPVGGRPSSKHPVPGDSQLPVPPAAHIDA